MAKCEKCGNLRAGFFGGTFNCDDCGHSYRAVDVLSSGKTTLLSCLGAFALAVLLVVFIPSIFDAEEGE